MCFNSLISYAIVLCMSMFLFYCAVWRHVAPEVEYNLNATKRLLAGPKASPSLSHRHILPVEMESFKEILDETCERVLTDQKGAKLQRSIIWNMAAIMNTLLVSTPVVHADQLNLQPFFEYFARTSFDPSNLDARTTELLAKHFAKDHYPLALAHLASGSPHFDRIRPLITRLIPADAAQFLNALPCFRPASLVELFDPVIHDNNALLGAMIHSATSYRITAPILIGYLNQPGISRAELLHIWQSVQANMYTVGGTSGAVRTIASPRLFDNINRNLLCVLVALSHEPDELDKALNQFMSSVYEDMLKRLFRMTLDSEDLESVWNLTVMASRSLAINADNDDFKRWSPLVESTLQAERFEAFRMDQEKYNATYAGVMELFKIRRENDINNTEEKMHSYNKVSSLFNWLCLAVFSAVRHPLIS